MKIIKTETKIDIEPLARAKGFLKSLYMYPPKAKSFEKVTRLIMSEETKAALDVDLLRYTTIHPKDCKKMLGMKILIDNDIPYGECEIFINAWEANL